MSKKYAKTTIKVNAKNNKDIRFLLISAILILAILTSVILFIIPSTNNNIRRNRILSIYNSLNLDEQKYIIKSGSIFGEKKVYEWDSGRSQSSRIDYVRSANVDDTVKELKQAISKTNFTFYEEPYPGSADFMYIYKSPNNEYLRVSASSKPRTDDFYNRYQMGLSMDNLSNDMNIGPSNVQIKVNLDDNNE